MKLSQFLTHVDQIAIDNDWSRPFICGGLPRDKVLGIANARDDIDITTGNNDASLLAKEIANKMPSARFISLPGNHSRVMIDSLKLDFSTNFRIKDINKYLTSINVNPTPMLEELYSRDFTCNSLLLSMNLKEVFDPMNRGIADIKSGILKTNLNPAITIGADPKRAVRAIYMVAKTGFVMDFELEDYLFKNKNIFGLIKPEYLTKKLLKAIHYNKIVTKKYIDKFELTGLVNAEGELKNVIQNQLGRS